MDFMQDYNDRFTVLPIDMKKLVKKLNEHLKKKFLVVTGECTSVFDGRIKSRLETGERQLIIKKDLSIILHESTGMRPVQWQLPRAGSVTFVQDDNCMRMETYRDKTDESFFITFSAIFHAIAYDVKNVDLSAEVMGHEKDLVDYLQNNPGKIEEGLKIIEREKEVDFGFIDLFARDSSGKNTVIEVKRQQAVLADAQQLKRYIENFAQEGQEVRGILVAASIPDKVNKYLKSFNLESREIPWQEIFPTVERPKNILRSKKLDGFFKTNENHGNP